MKNITEHGLSIFFTVSFLIMFSMGLAGCKPEYIKELEKLEPVTKVNVTQIYSGAVDLWDMKYQGHSYLVSRVSSGTAMIHSESCPCKPKADK